MASRTRNCRRNRPYPIGLDLLHRSRLLGEHLSDALDLGADGAELFFDVFVAAVYVVDAVDDGFAVGDQGGEDEGGGGAQVAGEHGGGAELSFAADHGAVALDFNVRTHADQFLSVHEAVLENIFGDDRRAFGLRGQRHELGLHVGGKSGKFFGGHIRGGEGIVAHHAHGVGGRLGLDSDFLEFAEDRAEVSGIASGDVEVAAGHGSGDKKCAGFDAVGNDAVLRAFQFAHAFHADGCSAGAFNLRSHFVEQGGKVGDFRLASTVMQNGLAFGESGCHEQVFGAGDGDFVENDFCTLQAIGGGFDVAVILRDFCAELFEAFDVHVDGAAADGAAAGQRDAGASAAGDERSEDERGGAHGFDQFVGGFGAGEIFAVKRGAVLGASVAEFDLGAHGGEQIARGLNVAHLGNVFEDDRFVGEQSGGHAGERGVLCAADTDRTEERFAAADDEFIHE